VQFESVAEHWEALKEETAVVTFGALKKQYGEWHLAIGCRWELTKWTQGNGGSWKKLATTSRRKTHNAITAPCKGHSCQGQGRDNVAREPSKRQTFRKRHQVQPECNNGIMNPDLKEQLRMGSRRTLNKTFR
jgi:hypothetical protein